MIRWRNSGMRANGPLFALFVAVAAVGGGAWRCLAAEAPPADGAFVWIEGERPASRNVEPKLAGWGATNVLSDGAWLTYAPADAAKIPGDGAQFRYDFEVRDAGACAVWARLAFETARSPFAWRVDQEAWRPSGPAEPTHDLMEIADYCQVSWVKLGTAELAAGPHAIEFRVPRPFKDDKGKQVPDALRFGLDALCLTRAAFRPNGKYKPGEEWRTEADRQAEARVVELDPARAADLRHELPLGGIWTVGRWDETEIVDRDGPTAAPNVGELPWVATTVPGNKFKDRHELRQCHRQVYRLRLRVPAEYAGRSFVFRFPAVSLIGTLFVNGQYCGFTKAPFALWECDATRAIRPGQVNDLCVVIKDNYYAISPEMTKRPTRSFFGTSMEHFNKTWTWAHCDFPIGDAVHQVAASSGILMEPSLRVAGPVYVGDVFAIPSVRKKELALELTLANPTDIERTVRLTTAIEPAGGGPAEKTFAQVELAIPAGGERVVTLREPWEQPKLWWPEEPNLYVAVTTLALDGKVVDVERTRFGFREWAWDGPRFRLNGVPWTLRGDIAVSDATPMDEILAYLKRSGQNLHRFWDPLHAGGLPKHEALDRFDEAGVIVKRNGLLEGMACNYSHALGRNTKLGENWIGQLQAMVREERNHPSILIWAIENEVTLINARNCGQLDSWEPRVKAAAKAVMALDPTRPAMIDGGNALRDGSLPVSGAHYVETTITPPGIPLREYPDEAYTWTRIVENEKQLFPLPPDKPVFMGEAFFMNGFTFGELAMFGGEECFAGWGPGTARGGGLFAKMLTEGFRWKGIAAWQLLCEGTMHHNSQKAVAVFCRQWNWTFAAGGQVARTLKVFNDTHRGEPIDVAWELTVGGKRADGGRQRFELTPGESREFAITPRMPAVERRTAGELVLTCSRGGQEVFRDVKPLAVIDPEASPRPALKVGELLVLDPHGAVKARLAKRGIAFGEARTLADLPGKAKVVVVGQDALTAREATDPKWLDMAAAGVNVLVLDQTNPLRYQALPADLEPSTYTGRVAFAEDIGHPVFAGLGQEDFFTWSGDHVVYRNVYAKASRGALSLAHCDVDLAYSAIAQCPANDGLLLLCQMAVGDKLASDPVAQRLFDNLLAYAAAYQPVRNRTAVALKDGPALDLLRGSGLEFDAVAGPLEAIRGETHRIVIFQATPAALRELADNPEPVRAYASRGGWLIAWGLTPEGLADFNRLVGIEHLLRPFELEHVTLASMRDPILSGVSVRDVAMESNERIFPWVTTKYMADDAFTHIVDLDEIGPFAEIPDAPVDKARRGDPSWPRNVFNGFDSHTAWKLIYYMSRKGPTQVMLKLPRPEAITRFSLVPNTDYAAARKVNLYFDADPEPVVLQTEPVAKRQDFPLPPRTASLLTVELTDFSNDKPTTGIDNLWIGVERNDAWRAKVKPLLNIGGLVKYPMGPGGLVLNQLRIGKTEINPVNAQKKAAIVTALLRNLHATFAGGRIPVAESLTYQPLPLEERCNDYLTKDRGWFKGERDLSHLPVGEVKLLGVPYVIRDHRTSPVPSCAMLAGPGTRNPLPDEVKGLPVGCLADRLYFLHAFHRGATWKPGKPGEEPPVVFRYVIHYEDGRAETAPVLYGQGADHWISPNPAGLKSAALAWSAPFGGESSAEQAAVYQFRWNNPRPRVRIASIDLVYGPAKSRHGSPALLAVTAARASE